MPVEPGRGDLAGEDVPPPTGTIFVMGLYLMALMVMWLVMFWMLVEK